jgi:CyaY protein
VSPNSPVSQIWVSAHSKSFKLDWDPGRAAFVLAGTGQTLADLMADAVGKQLGQEVAL